jgi:hypothetical protein
MVDDGANPASQRLNRENTLALILQTYWERSVYQDKLNSIKYFERISYVRMSCL